ncbi:MAG: hypothetical protein IKA02_04560, partial [Clostridia bacterium]|nr:hypothetical protein [Clostridia bacterium]
MKNISKICLIISALILIFTLISCQNSHTDTSSDTAGDTDTGVSTDSENSPPLNTDEPIYNDGKLIITNADSIEFYPTYDLGNYFGNGFKTVYDDFEGKIEYEIMQDYDETVESTTFGADVDEKIFETHYIVVLKLPDNYPDKSGFFGIKKLRKAGSINAADVVYKTPYNMSDVEYHYVVVPKSHLESWDDEGIIEMMWEEIDYLNYTVNVEVESDFREVDGYTELLTKSQLETYISTNDLPVYASTLALVPYYLVCFSKGNVETISFVRPTYENDVVEVTRDISVSASKSERAYLSIIPVNIN